MTPEELRRLAEHMSRMSDQFQRLQGNPQWQESMRKLVANQETLQAAFSKIDTSELQRAAEVANRAIRSMGIQAQADQWRILGERIDQLRLFDARKRLDDLDPATASDPELALEWATEDVTEEVPGDWAEVPEIAPRLPAPLRRELALRVGTLVVAIYIFAAALAQQDGDEIPTLLQAWIAIGSLYSIVLSAIEDAEGPSDAKDET
jgi:hypothetical protein